MSFLLSVIAMTVPAGAGARFALVVGNAAYQNAPQLVNPANDSALMARTLEQAGFTVTLLNDVDYRSLKKA
ncbi:MAG: caspase family protein, partial [Nitratireductor sp.]|nr:caspase family protein [Nitratireductor sp.]